MEKELLQRFLELGTLSVDISKWSVANFKNNPPRLHRLQMIDSLMKALEINGSYEELQYGEFLYEEGRQDLAELVKRLQENYGAAFDDITIEQETDYYSQFIFEMLLRYRIRLHQLVNVKACVLEAFGMNYIPLKIMSDIDTKLIKEAEGIDNILYYLLNPKGIRYTIAELKTKFHYPEVDLDEIDLEWI